MGDGKEILAGALTVSRAPDWFRVSKGGTYGGIGGVTTRGDPNQTVEGCQACWIKEIPPSVDEDFEAGMEIGRIELTSVKSGVSRGNTQCPAESNAEVGEIAANPLAA